MTDHLSTETTTDTEGDGLWVPLKDRSRSNHGVRRAIQELPEVDGAEIVPAGDGLIEAIRHGFNFTARYAIFDSNSGLWIGLWQCTDGPILSCQMRAEHITDDTWKVDEK